MADAPAASIADFFLGLAVASGQDGGNRFSVEGLSLHSTSDGALEIGMRKFEMAALRLVSGPLVAEIGRLALHALVARVRVEGDTPRLSSIEAERAELSGVKVQGPLNLSHSAGAWSLAPLATADGVINAEIVDATLVFDADVRVPIRQGLVDFNEATVAHVGPDSRMGVSRLGLYVDAPNGRSYLYQFSSAPVAGVEYERRSALPGPWGAKRGNLQLQPFGESLLSQGAAQNALGITEQARLLFERTALSGHLQLGNGKFAAPGLQADLAGRAAGDNVVRLRSKAVGRGLAIDVAALSVRSAAARAGTCELACDELAGAVVLQVSVDGKQLRAALDVTSMTVTRLLLRPV
jgi:hypothetical protein